VIVYKSAAGFVKNFLCKLLKSRKLNLTGLREPSGLFRSYLKTLSYRRLCLYKRQASLVQTPTTAIDIKRDRKPDTHGWVMTV
jgi:hypothetical protein